MTLTPALTEFIERTGVALQGYVPRAAGELFALLAITPEPLSIDEIACALKQSRAGVSSSIRFLETQDVIDRLARSGCRHDLFALRKDSFDRIVSRIANRLHDIAEIAREAAADAPSLNEMTTTFEHASACLDPRRHS